MVFLLKKQPRLAGILATFRNLLSDNLNIIFFLSYYEFYKWLYILGLEILPSRVSGFLIYYRFLIKKYKSFRTLFH